MPFGFPVVLDLTDVPVLVVGGGAVAGRKAAQLLEAGARLTVVAPAVTADLAARVAEVRTRGYVTADLDGHQLVLTATDDPAVNAQVAHDARSRGLWVNSADDPANCTFILPAVARRGPVVVAVGTDGSSPALARHLRDRIAEEVLTPNVEAAAVELARQRAEFHAQGVSTETVDWSDRLRAALDGPTGTIGRTPQPVIEVDDELRLRPFADRDAAMLIDAYATPDIRHYHFRSLDEDGAMSWIAATATAWKAERAATWAIADAASDHAIGRITSYLWPAEGRAEVSYWVVPSARGRGVASRACIAVTRWAHGIGVERVELQHTEDNDRSRRVAARAGFVEEGVKRRAQLLDDGWHDMVLHSHLATDG